MAREMKDSGIEWIGEIPKEHRIYRLKYLLRKPLDYGANSSGVDRIRRYKSLFIGRWGYIIC